MTLDARVVVSVGERRLDLELGVDDGEVVAVVGPNGAGKTTLLRVLAGLLPVEEGRVVVDGDVVDDAAVGVWVPPERRPVGVVFQDHLLFPHLTALENVAFGLRCRGRGRRRARIEAQRWLDRLGMGDRAGDRPATLSGGQAQRIALARALAVEPRLLLLDEPLSALDAAARPGVRAELRHQLASFPGTRLVVTHDPVDALVLADRLVVVEDGRVVQAGPVADISRQPRSRYVARLVGRNLLHGRGDRHRVLLDGGGQVHVADMVESGPVFVAVRPESVAVHRRQPEGTPRNVWSGRVAGLDVEGDRVRVAVDGPVTLVAEVTPGAAADLGLVPGVDVWLTVKATDVEVYPA